MRYGTSFSPVSSPTTDVGDEHLSHLASVLKTRRIELYEGQPCKFKVKIYVGATARSEVSLLRSHIVYRRFSLSIVGPPSQ
jgi:hypothetical protein